MISPERALRLVDLTYETVETPELLPSLIEKINAELKATTSFLMTVNPSKAAGAVYSTSRDMDKTLLAKYETYYQMIPAAMRERAARLFAEGNVALTQQICPDRTLERTEYHEQFLKPLNSFHGLGAGIVQNKHEYSLLSIMRPRNWGPFEEDTVASIRILLPHLRRAARLRAQAEVLAGLGESVQSMRPATVLLGDAGKVLFANARAERIIRQRDGLELGRDGALREMRRGQHRLAELCTRAAKTSQGRGFEPGGPLLIERPSGKPPYWVFVSPIHHSHEGPSSARPLVVVSIGDPEDRPLVSPEILARMFGLTHAEARLAAMLVEGKELAEACAKLSIRKNTGRAHLRSLFDKLHVHRQAELVSLLLRLTSCIPESREE